MFLSDTHLPQVLSAWHYTSQEQLDREMEHIFLPGWHMAACKSDLPRDGDYLTIELFDRPLIVWRCGDEYHTFLNVCPHRFSRLKKDGCGHAGERLQCQYHGWEFDCSGHTRKIPDARSFRPMTQGALGLTPVHTETCGQLIFVNLSDDPPPLREWLGPGYEFGNTLWAEEKRLALTLDYVLESNWKVKIENSLESYHMSMIHLKTLGPTPDAEICSHELEPGWTSFAVVEEAANPVLRFLDKLTHRMARVERDIQYKQYLFYPHFMCGKMRLFSWGEVMFPLSPTRTRSVVKVFCHGSKSRSWRGRILSRALAEWGKRFYRQVGAEDAQACAEVQRGLNAPIQPSEGVVSIREERCFHFQEYIRRTTAPELPTPRLAAMAAGG